MAAIVMKQRSYILFASFLYSLDGAVSLEPRPTLFFHEPMKLLMSARDDGSRYKRSQCDVFFEIKNLRLFAPSL